MSEKRTYRRFEIHSRKEIEAVSMQKAHYKELTYTEKDKLY